MKSKHDLFFNMLLTLFVVLLFSLIFEIVLRVLVISGPGWSRFMLVNDSALCYKWNPGFEGYLRGSGFQTDLKINSDGFRDVEYSGIGKKQLIISVGDSMTAALQVPLEKTFTKLLQDKLGKNYFVMNQGVIGYNPSQYYIVINQSVNKYHPKIILLNFFMGRFIKNSSDFRIAACDAKVVNGALVTSKWDQVTFFFKFRAELGYYSNLYNLVSQFISGQYVIQRMLYNLGFVQSNPYRSDLLIADSNNKDNKEYYETTFSILKDIRAVALKNNVKLVVVIVPQIDHVFPEYINSTIKAYGLSSDFNFSYQYNSLENFLKKEDISFLDLRESILNAGPSTYGVFDKHFSEKGHVVVSSALFNFLVQNKLVNNSTRL